MTHTAKLLSVLLLAAAAAHTTGCAEPDADDVAAAAAEAELGAASSFYCRMGEDWDYDLSVRVSHDGRKLDVAWGLDNIVEGSGVLDPDYRPRPDNANFVRFEGFRGLAGAFADAPERTTILVEKPLLEGKPGKVKLQFLQANGEFDQRINECMPE